MAREQLGLPKGKLWSHSRLKTYLQCKLKWFFQYVEKIKKPAGIALVQGTYLHKVMENIAMAREIGTQTEYIRGAIETDAVWESVLEEYEEIFLKPNEDIDEAKKTIDRILHLVAKNPETIPSIDPTSVEMRLGPKRIPGTDYFFHGYLDAKTKDGIYVDWKTRGVRRPVNDEHADTQATAYGWLIGHPIDFVYFDFLKHKRPSLNSIDYRKTKRGEEDTAQFEEVLVRVIEDMENGIVYPSFSMCHMCNYRKECSEWNG